MNLAAVDSGTVKGCESNLLHLAAVGRTPPSIGKRDPPPSWRCVTADHLQRTDPRLSPLLPGSAAWRASPTFPGFRTGAPPRSWDAFDDVPAVGTAFQPAGLAMGSGSAWGFVEHD